MGTLVIVHPALPDAPEGTVWDAFIEGHAAAFHLADLGELNATVQKLGLLDPPGTAAPDYLGEGGTGCDGYLCGLAATGTVIWAPPGEYMARRGCPNHQEESRDYAARSELPCATIPALISIPQDQFFRTRGADMARLARALVGYDIPEVFPQPRCAKCKARICPQTTLERLAWQDADGGSKCKRRGDHATDGNGIAGVIELHYVMLVEDTPAPEAAASA